jgi:hypothetical protein
VIVYLLSTVFAYLSYSCVFFVISHWQTMGSSIPKYHITAVNGGGPDGTTWYTHTHDAFDERYCMDLKRDYKKNYPKVTIVLTPESGPFGMFTRFPSGYRHWGWTENYSFVSQIRDLPKEHDD